MNQAIYTGATFVVQTLQDVPLLRRINEVNSMKQELIHKLLLDETLPPPVLLQSYSMEVSLNKS